MTKKLIEISNNKVNLEKQAITLKHLNIQLEKQIMSIEEQTEKENNVGTVVKMNHQKKQETDKQ